MASTTRGRLMVALLAGAVALPLAAAWGAPGPGDGPGGRGPRPSPRAMCLDRAAMGAAFPAFVEARLAPTPEQGPAFAAFAEAASGAAARLAAGCGRLPEAPPEGRPGLIERLDGMEAGLRDELEAIGAAKPALAALYQALDERQRAVLDSLPPFGPPHGPGRRGFGPPRP